MYLGGEYYAGDVTRRDGGSVEACSAWLSVPPRKSVNDFRIAERSGECAWVVLGDCWCVCWCWLWVALGVRWCVSSGGSGVGESIFMRDGCGDGRQR
jgi:hypothetical protein